MKPSILNSEGDALIGEFLEFVNASPSPYHAVEWIAQKLESTQKFQRLDERKNWGELEAGNYYVTRNQSTIIAFSIPLNHQGDDGFTIMAGHTDSPCFRLKPRSKITKGGSLQCGVETYGGGLWNTWFDRDLSVAGRVCVRSKAGAEEKTQAFESRLVRINRPIMRISNLAIHLNRKIRSEGFKFNYEDHCVPTLATEFAAKAEGQLNADTKSPVNNDHHPLLLRLLAAELGVEADDIVDFELYVYDTQPSCVGGAFNEFIFSPRLDNLMSCFVCLKALLNANDSSLEEERNIRVLCCFDNEEIGSNSNRGAASNMLLSTMRRLKGREVFEASIQKSFLISSDMAHAQHENYAAKHEGRHNPKMHEGLVLKFNCNQRYASNMATAFHLCEVARQKDIPLQKFVVRNDQACGSTIGPICATACGLRTIDVGIPQLSMHSVREVCGVADVVSTTALFTGFYEQFVALDQSFNVDA